VGGKTQYDAQGHLVPGSLTTTTPANNAASAIVRRYTFVRPGPERLRCNTFKNSFEATLGAQWRNPAPAAALAPVSYFWEDSEPEEVQEPKSEEALHDLREKLQAALVDVDKSLDVIEQQTAARAAVPRLKLGKKKKKPLRTLPTQSSRSAASSRPSTATSRPSTAVSSRCSSARSRVSVLTSRPATPVTASATRQSVRSRPASAGAHRPATSCRVTNATKTRGDGFSERAATARLAHHERVKSARAGGASSVRIASVSAQHVEKGTPRAQSARPELVRGDLPARGTSERPASRVIQNSSLMTQRSERSDGELALAEAKVRQTLELEEMERRHKVEMLQLERRCEQSESENSQPGAPWPDPSWIDIMTNPDLDLSHIEEETTHD